ncbi:MAG: AraC family transcriptional regulator [Komarekiella atlantica HA4396-MV6]|jgi:AraC family transcriptional regulator|nr:AraC family transcriptional regulator [Komarekiella atlantica HA4396-MV6]
MQSVSILSSPYYLQALWQGVSVEYSLLPPDEVDFRPAKNLIGVALAPQERVTWRINNGSSKTTPLPPASVFLYSSGGFVWSRWEKPTECVHITLAPDLLNRVAADCSLPNNFEIEHRIMFADPTILHVAQLFKSEILNGGLAGKLYTESLRNLLAVHLLRNYSSLSSKPALEDGPLSQVQLNQLKDFIEDRLTQDLTIADLAAVVHMSPFHFARTFKTAIGQPPHRYLTQQRMERAKFLLSVTRLTVAEVAYRVGFDNKSHFSAQFRKATGTTPKVYRDSF